MQTSFFEIGGAIRTSGLPPSVHIAPPISQNSVRIYRCALARLTAFLQYVRARLTVLTLLLKKLEPSSYINYNQFLKGIPKFEKTKKETEILSLLALCTLAVYCDSLIHKDPLNLFNFGQITL